MEDGWIKLHRKMRDWQYYQCPSVRLVFEELLFCANTKPSWFHGFKVNRGETMVSVSTIEEYTGFSRKTVIKALALLEKSGEIKREKKGNFTKTTVLKFNQYQDNEKLSGGVKIPPPTPPPSTPLSTPPSTPEQEYKKEKKDKNNNLSLSNTRTKEEFSWAMEVVNATAQVETFCMQEHITPQEFKNYAFAVMNEWEMVGKTHTDRSDMKSHLIATIRKKIQDQKTQKINGNNRTSNWQQTNGAGREQRAAAYMSAIASLAAEDDARAAKVRQS